MTPRLYRGEVVHTRRKPVAHRLRYRMSQVRFDLDEGPSLDQANRLFGFNRAGLISFHERDHGDGSATPLKRQIERLAEARGHAVGGPIEVLCMPRVFGFAFNPITIYLCHDAGQRRSAVVYEVNNTFGDRTAYVLGPDGDPAVLQSTRKTMHVSPFMAMDHEYDFHIRDSDDAFSIAIAVRRADEVWLAASFAGRASPFTDAGILALVARDPLATFKVVAAIHFEALKLRLKGLPFLRKPHGRMTISDV